MSQEGLNERIQQGLDNLSESEGSPEWGCLFLKKLQP
jgi:hypothetical protein